ncbi:MAG TPA: alkaline phosphatase, partial [Dyadobacter sp.]|nr:alkaline phosphatase [Dyadobacter sp.]
MPLKFVQYGSQRHYSQPRDLISTKKPLGYDGGSNLKSLRRPCYAVNGMPDFDRLVGEALKFADSNGETLVIVTGDHETGGLTLLDGNLKTGYVDGHFSTDDHTGIIVPVFA